MKVYLVVHHPDMDEHRSIVLDCFETYEKALHFLDDYKKEWEVSRRYLLEIMELEVR